mmetsp:Transcript_120685/g.225494  ORF Transcript_120685/g.225494 Transcript_120685/m.225494 type:complete len:421 (-) Transcript_120685:114-1376(-)
MGNVCIAREDSPRVDIDAYKKYFKLRNEVSATLADSQGFGEECSRSYRQACQTRGLTEVSKTLMREMTWNFIQRVSCDDDPRTVQQIGAMLENRFPSNAPIMEDMFKDFIRDVLIQLEWDLNERLRKLQMKHPGIMEAVERSTAEASSSNSGYHQERDTSFRENSMGLTDCCGAPRGPPGRYMSPMQYGDRPPQAPDDPLNRSAYSTMPPLPIDNLHAMEDPLRTNDARVQQLQVPPTLPPTAFPPGAYPPMAEATGGAQDQLAVRAQDQLAVRGMRPAQGMTQEDVERMKRQIMSGTDGLPVKVYNQNFALEPKRLSMNAEKGLIGIFQLVEGGLGYPTAFFGICDLKGITQGIGQSIMENPPPPELALAFRFSQADANAVGAPLQDRFLCVVFDRADMCFLAAEAFSQLIGVPVTFAS